MIGLVGVILVFNFLVVVWCWNVVFVYVCGDSVIWKLFEKLLFIGLVVKVLFDCVVVWFCDEVLDGLLIMLIGGCNVGE